jgi:hypothetical protein
MLLFPILPGYMSALAACWMLGGVMTALLAWAVIPRETVTLFGKAVPAWRVFLFCCSLPAGLACLLQWLGPESPKWLFLQGRRDEALRVLRSMAHHNRSGVTVLQSLTSADALQAPESSVAPSRNEFTSLLSASPSGGVTVVTLGTHSTGGAVLAAPGAAEAGFARDDPRVGIIGAAASGAGFAEAEERGGGAGGHGVAAPAVSLRERLAELFSPTHRRTTLKLATVWFSLSFGFYGLSVWMPNFFKHTPSATISVYASSLLSAFSQLPGNLFSIYAMDRYNN